MNRKLKITIENCKTTRSNKWKLIGGIVYIIFEDDFCCITMKHFTTLEDQIVEQFYLARLIQFESFFSYKKWGNPY